MAFAFVVSPSTNPRKHTMAHSNNNRECTAGERIFGFVCDMAVELAEVLKGFTGVGMGGNGSLGYFNAKADWNIDIISSAHTPPSTKGDTVVSACQNKRHPHSGVRRVPISDIVHQRPPSNPPPWPPLPARDFEGVDSGATAFQTTESDENIEGNADERFVMTNKIARARRLFRSRRAASLRRGLRKSRKVRLLVIIVSVQQVDRVSRIRGLG